MTPKYKYTTIILLVVLTHTIATANQNEEITLNTTYPVTIGDYSALMLINFLVLSSSPSDVRAVVTYEPDDRTIDLEIFGPHTQVEDARRTIEDHWRLITGTHIPYVKRRFNITLTEENYRILYHFYSKQATRSILQFNRGVYVIP